MGEDPDFHKNDFADVMELISTIKKETGLPVMISPGLVPDSLIDSFTEVGADWYALYQETHNRSLFSRLRLHQSYDERMHAKLYAKSKGMKYWQFSTSATDANRFALRLCREVTQRPKVLVYNWCYHGTVDETVAVLDEKTGKTVAKEGSLGPQCDPGITTKVIEWNDVEALENALKDKDVAAVLAEPVMKLLRYIIEHPQVLLQPLKEPVDYDGE